MMEMVRKCIHPQYRKEINYCRKIAYVVLSGIKIHDIPIIKFKEYFPVYKKEIEDAQNFVENNRGRVTFN